MPKKILDRRYRKPPEIFLNNRSLTTFPTQIRQNHIARADQQMNREWIALEKPGEYRAIRQFDQRSAAIFVDRETGCPRR